MRRLLNLTNHHLCYPFFSLSNVLLDKQSKLSAQPRKKIPPKNNVPEGFFETPKSHYLSTGSSTRKENPIHSLPISCLVVSLLSPALTDLSLCSPNRTRGVPGESLICLNVHFDLLSTSNIPRSRSVCLFVYVFVRVCMCACALLR